MVTTSTVLQENTWGIAEPLLSAPTNGDLIPPTDLDLVLLPLVAFDTACNRLGMGQGYYDRTFAFKQASPASRPYLAGLAHQCQLLERVPSAPHDVPLDAIITDQHSYFRQG